jgi:beta-RFAP synthase
MFSFGDVSQRQFGGIGAMIDTPGLRLAVTPADRFQIVGPLAERIEIFADRYFSHFQISPWPDVCLELCETPPQHVGLGVGTQLGLSVVAALHAFLGQPPLDATLLASISGRAERSAIGTYGFLHGGLIAEAGKEQAQELSPLIAHVLLPKQWRFVLVIPAAEQGKHGSDERQAFRTLPPVPRQTTEILQRLAYEALVPAADASDWPTFSRALYEYGRLAGVCYESVQHGVYATERLDMLVQKIRSCGISGVGQTSWGPTIFALTDDEMSAGKLVQSLSQAPEARGCQFLMAAPSQTGANIKTE